MESIIEETNNVQCIDAVTKIAINSASSLSQSNVSGLMTSQNPEPPDIKSHKITAIKSDLSGPYLPTLFPKWTKWSSNLATKM